MLRPLLLQGFFDSLGLCSLGEWTESWARANEEELVGEHPKEGFREGERHQHAAVQLALA